MSTITFTTIAGTNATARSEQAAAATGTGQTTTGSGIAGDSTTVPTNTTAQTQGGATTNPFNGSGVDSKAGNRLDEAQTQLKDAIKSLNDLIKSLRDPDMLANLMVEFSAMQRQQALDQRLASRDAAKSQLEGQAAETREAAVKEIAAAAVALVMAVVSFAVSVGGALKMGKEVAKGMDAGKDVMKAEKQITQLEEKLGDINKKISSLEKQADTPAKADALKSMNKQKAEVQLELGAAKTESKVKGLEADAAFRRSDQLNHYTSAITGLINGLGEAMGATLRASAKFDEAQGQVLAANAEDTKADADAMKSFMDSIDELIQTALQFIQKLNDAEVELMASASRL